MQNYIDLFTLLTFSSVVVFAGLQEVLNVAKCIADIHKELPNSCVFFMKSEEEEEGEKTFNFFSHRNIVSLKIICLDFVSSKVKCLLGNTILENKRNV